MNAIANALVALVALEHLWFLVLEMFLWTKPLGLRTFRQSEEKARASAALAANQGLYNGFLAAGLVWGLLAAPPEFALLDQGVLPDLRRDRGRLRRAHGLAAHPRRAGGARGGGAAPGLPHPPVARPSPRRAGPCDRWAAWAAGTGPFRVAGAGLAVEKAMNRSPEPLPDTLPVRARPSAARRARRFSWCGSSGASVATTMMIEPVSVLASTRRSSRISQARPGTPAIAQLVAQAEVRLHQHADACSRRRLARSTPRGGADAALELEADHARAAADVALGHRSAGARAVEAPRRRARPCTCKPSMSFRQPS